MRDRHAVAPSVGRSARPGRRGTLCRRISGLPRGPARSGDRTGNCCAASGGRAMGPAPRELGTRLPWPSPRLADPTDAQPHGTAATRSAHARLPASPVRERPEAPAATGRAGIVGTAQSEPQLVFGNFAYGPRGLRLPEAHKRSRVRLNPSATAARLDGNRPSAKTADAMSVLRLRPCQDLAQAFAAARRSRSALHRFGAPSRPQGSRIRSSSLPSFKGADHRLAGGSGERDSSTSRCARPMGSADRDSRWRRTRLDTA